MEKKDRVEEILEENEKKNNTEQGYCASMEWAAGSGEQELLSEFFKYRNFTKNRNFDGFFFQKNYF
jgi:hypothetical protein